MVNWRFHAIFPLCASEITKNIRNLMCSIRTISLRSLQAFLHRKPGAWQTKPHTRHPCHSALLFRKVSSRRRLRTQSSRFTSVGLGNKRLSQFAHSVLVITLSQTSFMALVCLRGLLRVGSRIVIANLQPRCRWCRVFLIAHLDVPRVGIVMWCSRGRCASQRAPSPFVRLFTFTRGSA